MEWDEEKDYLLTIVSVEPKMSHPGKPCPAEAMWVIASLGLVRLVEASTLELIMTVPDDGRACPSVEIWHKARRALEVLGITLFDST